MIYIVVLCSSRFADDAISTSVWSLEDNNDYKRGFLHNNSCVPLLVIESQGM